MKTLILLRHAKSSWAEPGIDDHDRPLNARGKASAPVVASWLERRRLLPAVILCSSAVRTRETVERMRKTVPALPVPDICPNLYHAGPDAMLRTVHALPDDASTAMLVGHEPGISAFAHLIDDGAVDPALRRAFAHFPTAAAAVFRLDAGQWSALRPMAARFTDFVAPRELGGR